MTTGKKDNLKFFYTAFLSFALALIILFGCGETAERRTEDDSSDIPEINDSVKAWRKDSAEKAELKVKLESRYPEIHYKAVKIRDISHLKQIRKKYNHPTDWRAAWKTIMTLNRKEWRFFRPGQTIILPDTIVDDIKAYSLFPQYYQGAADLPKIIMVSAAFQCYGAYEYGKLIRFAAVNSGKEKTPTFPGRYALVWKERVRRSSLDSNWVMPYTYNFHGEAGNAFHQFDMPGYPASHSCVRQFMDDAEWLFNWGRGERRDTNGRTIRMSGTPVVIIDYYDFNWGRKGPWLKLTSNKDTILQLPPDPMKVEEALIPIVQIPYSSRGRLHNRQRFEHAEQILRERGIIRKGVVLTPTVNYNAKRREEAQKKWEEEQKKQQNMQTEDSEISPENQNNVKKLPGANKDQSANKKKLNNKPNGNNNTDIKKKDLQENKTKLTDIKPKEVNKTKPKENKTVPDKEVQEENIPE